MGGSDPDKTLRCAAGSLARHLLLLHSMTAALGIAIEAAAPAVPSLGKTAAGRLGSVSEAGGLALTGGKQPGVQPEAASFRARWQALLVDQGASAPAATESGASEPCAPAPQIPSTALLAGAGHAAQMSGTKAVLVNPAMTSQAKETVLAETQTTNEFAAGRRVANNDHVSLSKGDVVAAAAAVDSPHAAPTVLPEKTAKSAYDAHRWSSRKKPSPLDSPKKTATVPSATSPGYLFLATPAPVAAPVPPVAATPKPSSLPNAKANILTNPSVALDHDTIPVPVHTAGKSAPSMGRATATAKPLQSAFPLEQGNKNAEATGQSELSSLAPAVETESSAVKSAPQAVPSHAAQGNEPAATEPGKSAASAGFSGQGVAAPATSTQQNPASPDLKTTLAYSSSLAVGAKTPLHSDGPVGKHDAEKPTRTGAMQPMQPGSPAVQAAHPAMTAAIPAHTSPDAAGVISPASDSIRHEPGAALPTARETFATLDGSTGAPATGAATWLHAGPHRAEAGFQDPALGWVGVRADNVGGGAVHASLVAGSADAAQTLSTHLEGLNAYLLERHSELGSVTLTAPDNGAASWNAHSSMSQDGQSGRQGGEQGAYPSDARDRQQGISGSSSRWAPDSTVQAANSLPALPVDWGRSRHVSVRV